MPIALGIAIAVPKLLAGGAGIDFLGYYRPVTVNSIEVTGTHKDVPVLYRFTDNDLRHTSFGGKVEYTDGRDIRFFEAADQAVLIDYEIASYDPTTGDIEAHLVLSISSAADTNLIIAYGDATVLVAPNVPTDVWPTSTYRLVAHLADDAANTTVKDSTANANNGTASTNTSNLTQATVAGKGFDFLASSSEYVNFGDPAQLDFTTHPLVIAATVRFNTYAAGQFPLNKRGLGATGYELLRDGAGTLRLRIQNSGAAFADPQVSGLNDSNEHRIWTYCDGIFARVYVDGPSIINQFHAGGDFSNAQAFQLGARGGANFYDGWLKGVKLLEVIPSDDYIATESNNFLDPTNFTTTGAEVPY